MTEKSQTNRGKERVGCLQGSCSAAATRMLLFPPSAKSDWLARPSLAMKWPPRDARQAQAEGSARGLPDPLPAAAPRHPPAALRPPTPSCTHGSASRRQPPSPAVGTVPDKPRTQKAHGAWRQPHVNKTFLCRRKLGLASLMLPALETSGCCRRECLPPSMREAG